MFLKGRCVCAGYVEGEALTSKTPISFYGGVDAETGIIVEPGHDLNGLSISNKILFFPYGKGSTVGSYVLYRMVKLKTAPKAIVNIKTEPIIATGCILGDIPLVDGLKERDFYKVKSGDYVIVDASKGLIKIIKS